MMLNSLICAGNWKMNYGPQESQQFLELFAQKVSEQERSDFALFLPALNLHHLKNDSLPRLNWGAQNVYWESAGAFTGENSPEVLKQMSATHVLVGHSERRSLFGETNEQTQKKVQAIHAHQMTPVLCVGETLEQRKANQTLNVICEQLQVGIEGLSSQSPLWVAYEPVWAIGTGEVATPEQAEEAHKALRAQLIELWGDFGKTVPLLYGGSVKPENAFELAKKANVNGFLIGGASLKVDSFIEIWKQGKAAKAE